MKKKYSFFDHLRNVDEQRGICGRNVVFKSLSTYKEKDVAIVAVEECRNSLYYSSLYIHCPDINFLEHLNAGNKFHRDRLSFYTNYDLIFFTKFKNEPYLCFHKFISPEERFTLSRIVKKIASSCGDVMRAVLRVYIDREREALEDAESYKFDNLCDEFLERGTCNAEHHIGEHINLKKQWPQKYDSLLEEYSKLLLGGEKGIMFKTFDMDLVMFDWLVAELKKEKIKLPDGQFASKALGDLFFAANVRSWEDLFDKSQHDLERIMMADRLLTFRLEEKIKNIKYCYEV